MILILALFRYLFGMATGMASASAATSLDTILAGTTYVKLHTGDPGAAGTSNPAGNTTRAAVMFAAASGGAKTSNSDAVWTNVSTSETYTHFSVWSTVGPAGGTFLYSGTVTGGAVLAGNDFKLLSGQFVVNITPAS